MIAYLNRSEVCRIRNLLCQEICWLEHCKATDPENSPDGITKRQAKKNAKAVSYDRSALAALVPDAEAALEKYRNGRFARRLRIMERNRKKQSVGRLIFNVALEKAAERLEWRECKP